MIIIIKYYYQMGTNFYWFDDNECIMNDDIKIHIGKRSAAGLYCHDCGTTLCSGGIGKVHYGAEWYNSCPSCHKTKDKIGTTCSFTWTMMSHYQKIKKLMEDKSDKKCIIDEYSVKYTAKEFYDIVKECKIWSQYCGEFS
jgi:hypothetical protein